MILSTIAPLAGLCIGVFYFAGLWWTVRLATTFKQPGPLFAASFLIRTALALCGVYLVGEGSWSHFGLCLVGFIVGRIFVKRFVLQNQVMTQAEPGNGAQ